MIQWQKEIKELMTTIEKRLDDKSFSDLDTPAYNQLDILKDLLKDFYDTTQVLRDKLHEEQVRLITPNWYMVRHAGDISHLAVQVEILRGRINQCLIGLSNVGIRFGD